MTKRAGSTEPRTPKSAAMAEMLNRAAPVLPVITLTRIEQALPLADALAAGNINTLEITLRTPAGLGAIECLRSKRPELVIGAGTVLKPQQLVSVVDAGAQFAVSPGLSQGVLARADEAGIPYLPGTATLTEMMLAVDLGLSALKLFPAATSGGTALLRAAGSVLGDLVFCPTGGISGANYQEFLELENVACVGGSWIAPQSLINSENWPEIEKVARLIESVDASNMRR